MYNWTNRNNIFKTGEKKRHLAEILVVLDSHTPAPTWRTLALTHGMSVWPRGLAHWRRRGLHPRRRHTVRVGGHGRASHARHRGRVAVRSPGHAVVVPVLGRAGVHPRRPVMLCTTNAFRLRSRFSPWQEKGVGNFLPADHWWLVIAASRWSRCPSLGDGMTSGGGDRSLSQFGH